MIDGWSLSSNSRGCSIEDVRSHRGENNGDPGGQREERKATHPQIKRSAAQPSAEPIAHSCCSILRLRMRRYALHKYSGNCSGLSSRDGRFDCGTAAGVAVPCGPLGRRA